MREIKFIIICEHSWNLAFILNCLLLKHFTLTYVQAPPDVAELEHGPVFLLSNVDRNS